MKDKVTNPLFPAGDTKAQPSAARPPVNPLFAPRETHTIAVGGEIDTVEGVTLDTLSNPQMVLANARALREHAQAALAKLEYQRESGQYVPRETVIQQVAEIFQSLAQALKSIPDQAERRGVSDKRTLELITNAVDASLLDAQDRLKGMFVEAGGKL